MKRQQYNPSQIDRAWQDVERNFRSAGQASPTSGFVARWRARLAQQRLERERRVAWMMVILNILVGAVILFSLWVIFRPILPTIGESITIVANMFAQVAAYIRAMFTMLILVARAFSDLVPASIVMSLVGLTGGLLVMWMGLMRQYAQRFGLV